MQRAAFDAGILTPEPLFLSDEPWFGGEGFMLMTYLRGTSQRQDFAPNGPMPDLAAGLGRELAHIHQVKVDGPVTDDPVSRMVARMRSYLDGHPQPHPVLEWGLRWLEVNAPPVSVCLVHGDFRTGNYLVEEGRLSAVLDWEFADWSDPHADIGWFCAKCWRLGAVDYEAGGVGARDDFYKGYEEEAGARVDPALVSYWELMAHVRWAVIALQQVDRFRAGGSKRLELGLLGRRLAELEYEILQMTGSHAQ